MLGVYYLFIENFLNKKIFFFFFKRYDPYSLFAINTYYGDYKNLLKFVNEAHKRNIAVIIDWIPNHVNNKNIFENFDDDSQSCYFNSDEFKRRTRYGPKLNLENNNVRQYVKDSLKMWLRDFHFDGIRVGKFKII